MRVAVLDLGTNTFNLLIADVNGSSYTEIIRTKEIVKLGQGTISANVISEEAFKRGINALKNLSAIISIYHVDVIKALATSAIREAKNKEEFLSEAKKQTNINIETISGDQEAALIYYGNRIAFPNKNETYLIMDIGGGSNEFIIANAQTAFWKQSFKLGVARLLVMFKPENPISETTLQNIRNYLMQELQPLLNELKKYTITQLVGSSGAFESVVDMIGKEEIISQKNWYEINMEDYWHISKQTIQSTIKQRKQMKGLIPMRRDMIVLSYILIDFVINNCGIKKIGLSTYSLKEGAVTLFFNKQNV